MKKDIKDYLHLYLGCPCKWKLLGDAEWQQNNSAIDLVVLNRVYDRQPFVIAPILRPLSDMTEQEAREYAVCYLSYITDDVPVKIEPDEFGYIKVEVGSKEHGASLFPGRPHGDRPEAFRYLLSRGFDLFNLISKGLALDKTKINNQ